MGDGPRVLMVTERYLPIYGGTEHQLRLLAGALVARGAHVEVVTPRTLPSFERFDVIGGVPVHRLSFPRVRHLATAGLVMNLAAFLLRHGHRFDVIHAHTASHLAVVATLLGRILGKRIVLKAVGWWELEQGVLNPARARRPGYRFELAVLRRASAWVAVSRALERAILAAGVPPERVTVIPNGVDTGHFSPGDRAVARRALGLDPSSTRALFVGRLEPVKSLPTLLDAWRRVVDVVPNATLDVIGDGSCQPGLRERACALGIAGRVMFHGNRHDVVRWLRAANCYVLPSVMEGLSNTLLEAMAVGVPVVATRVSGTEDMIEPRVNGYLVTPGDDDDLARRLVAVLDDPEHAASLGRSASADVRRRCRIEHVVDAYLRLYTGQP